MRASFQMLIVLAFVVLLALQVPMAAFVFRPHASGAAMRPAVTFGALDEAAYSAVMRRGQTAWQVKARLSLVGAPVFDVGGVPAERLPAPAPLALPADFAARPPSALAGTAAACAPIVPPSFAAPETTTLPPEVLTRPPAPVARELLLQPDGYSSLNERK